MGQLLAVRRPVHPNRVDGVKGGGHDLVYAGGALRVHDGQHQQEAHENVVARHVWAGERGERAAPVAPRGLQAARCRERKSPKIKFAFGS